MPRRIKPLDEKRISVLPVERLLAYRERLLSLEESPELSDCELDEIESLDSSYIWFKSDSRWRKLYSQVIHALEKLENVNKG